MLRWAIYDRRPLVEENITSRYYTVCEQSGTAFAIWLGQLPRNSLADGW